MADAPIRCRIEAALGREEICPGERCAFWEEGAAGLGGCAFEKLDLRNNVAVADWLQHVRNVIEAERAP